MSSFLRLPSGLPAPCTFLLAAVLFAGVADALFRMPVQVSDSLEEMLEARQSPGAWSSFVQGLSSSNYLRPLRTAETKLLFDASGGHYFAAYKTFHAALLLAAFVLLARAFQVRDGADLAAATFALTVFTGHHTFDALVREAFPVNHFLQVLVLCLVAVNLLQTAPRWWVDVTANTALVAACLTLESGVLVWVILVAGRLAGWNGVSWRGIAVSTAIVAIYLGVRVVLLRAQLEALESGSGFLLETIEPDQIRERFNGRMSVFYGYTVLAQICSVLWAEPRHGVLLTIRSILAGDLPPRQVITVATSVATSLLLLKAAISEMRARTPWSDSRHVLLFAAVLPANALVSFAYAKEEIMSVAGAFYALAAFAIVRCLIRRPRPRSVLLAVLLMTVAVGWAFRSLSVHHVLRTQAFNVRNDWVTVVEFLQARDQWPVDAEGQALVLRLRADALAMPVPNPWFTGRWADRVFDVD